MNKIRRTILASLVASPILANAPFVNAKSDPASAVDSIDSQFNEWVVFDGLGSVYDINVGVRGGEHSFLLSERLAAAIKASGLTCMRQTAGLVYQNNNKNIFERCVSSIASYQDWIVQNSKHISLVRSVDDIFNAKKNGMLAVTFGFQNSFCIEDKLDRVKLFRDLGVLTMQLTYNGKNQIGGGANVDGTIPLSRNGHSIVEEMNSQNVLIDLSHGGEQTTIDSIKASSKPMTISHTGCRELVDIPRNKTNKELKMLADKGGVVGIYFMPFLATDSNATSEHLIQHIEHAINICGEDHVALGTDGGYVDIDDLEKTRDYFNEFTIERIADGNAAAGEKIGNVNFLPDIVGKEQFRQLARMLSKRGHSAERIQKIFGLNTIALLREVWKD